MPTYISLVSWTDQGIRDVKASPQRLDNFKKVVQSVGGTVNGFYLTMGKYDMVVIIDIPSDETAATLMLNTAKLGSIRTETLKAFTEDQYREIISKVA